MTALASLGVARVGGANYTGETIASAATSYHVLTTLVTLGVILPFCLIRQFGHLAWLSVVSIGTVMGVRYRYKHTIFLYLEPFW